MQIVPITQFNNNKKTKLNKHTQLCGFANCYIYGWQKFHYKRCIKALSRNSNPINTPLLSLSHTIHKTRKRLPLLFLPHTLLRLRLVECKIFSKCKILSGENIFGKGKYFLIFGYILKIILEYIFKCLVHFENANFLLVSHIFSAIFLAFKQIL